MRVSYLLSLSLLLLPGTSSAFLGSVWQYLSQYQVGVELSASRDQVKMEYDMDAGASIPSYCSRNINDSSKQICSHDVVGGQSSGYSLFLQQAFQRQGDWHFDADLSFGARYLTGEIAEEDLELIQSAGLPLTEASFTLGVAVIKPYIELGYTPSTAFPDILLRVGPVIQAGVGSFSINEKKEDVAVALSSGVVGYLELEFVFWRFGDGALSAYSSNDAAGKDGTPLYPNDVDGMSDFRGSFSRSVGGAALGYGIKLVLDWP